MNNICKIFFCFALLFSSSLLFSDEEVKPSLSISGYAQVRSESYSSVTGFSIPNAVVDLKSILAKNLEFKLELNAVAGSNAPNYSSVQECYLDWHPSEKFGLIIGKQFMLFTQAKNPSEWELIAYPSVLNELATIYDMGIVAYGSPFKFLSWRAGVVNGSESLSDFASNKQLFWSLSIKPTSWLSFGVASQSNRGYLEFTPNTSEFTRFYGLDLEFANNSSLFGDQKPGRTNYGRKRISAYLLFEGEAIAGLNSSMLIEYLGEEQDNMDGRGGLYMLFTQYITKKIQLALLSENFDCGIRGEKIYNSNAIGINYFPEKNIKLQMSYVMRDSVDGFLAQLQVRF